MRTRPRCDKDCGIIREFKITMLNSLGVLMEKVDNILEQIVNVIRVGNSKKAAQWNARNKKFCKVEKDAFDDLISRLDMAKRTIHKLEDKFL